MRIIIFALIFAVLAAAASFAEGLEVTKIDVHADYDYSTVYRLEQEQKTTTADNAPVPLQNGSSIKIDVFPGSNLTFTLTVENTFKDETQALREVTTKITIEGRHGEKLKELSGDFSLQAGREAKADVRFKIPFDIISGPHNVFIETEGTGKNHTAYKTELASMLDISKLSHDIRITQASLEPGIVDCKRKVQLSAEIMNSGSVVENQVALEFKSPSLGIDSFDKDIYLAVLNDDTDEQINHKKTLSIEVPSFIKSGTYPVFVNLYWQNFILFDQKTMYLTVNDCKPGAAKAKPAQEIKNETSVKTIQPAEETKIPAEGLITMTEELSILDSPVLLLMLLGGLFILMALVVLIFIGLLKKNRMH